MKVKLVGSTSSSVFKENKLYHVVEYERQDEHSNCDGAWVIGEDANQYYILIKGKEKICAFIDAGYWEVAE
jgi:hypothetical protein